MIAGKPRWVRWAIGAASLVRVAVGPALAETPPPPHPKESAGAPPAAHWHDDDSQRQEAIRRAREEILSDPEQKKFILFRLGLHEDDLR